MVHICLMASPLIQSFHKLHTCLQEVCLRRLEKCCKTESSDRGIYQIITIATLPECRLQPALLTGVYHLVARFYDNNVFVLEKCTWFRCWCSETKLNSECYMVTTLWNNTFYTFYLHRYADSTISYCDGLTGGNIELFPSYKY